MSQQESKRTTDHDEIRRWAEQRDGHPATVRGNSSDGTGILRIDFEDYGAGEDQLEEISWSEFFEKFDEKHLEFLYQERTSDGAVSRFCKFVSRE